MSFFEEMTPGKTVVLIAGFVVMGLILLLNAVFTFSYGYDIIGPFLLVSQLGAESSAILSGVVSVLFYDIAYIVGFATLLFACQSVWQYGIVGIQFLTTLALSILASVTSILLLSPLGEYVPESMLLIARYAGYGGLVVGFVVNALAGLGYVATNPDMAKIIRQSVRQAGDIATQATMVKEMDTESRKLAKAQIKEEIPFLAEIHAGTARSDYLLSLGLDPVLYGQMKRKMLALPSGDGRPVRPDAAHDLPDTVPSAPERAIVAAAGSPAPTARPRERSSIQAEPLSDHDESSEEKARFRALMHPERPKTAYKVRLEDVDGRVDELFLNTVDEVSQAIADNTQYRRIVYQYDAGLGYHVERRRIAPKLSDTQTSPPPSRPAGNGVEKDNPLSPTGTRPE